MASAVAAILPSEHASCCADSVLLRARASVVLIELFTSFIRCLGMLTLKISGLVCQCIPHQSRALTGSSTDFDVLIIKPCVTKSLMQLWTISLAVFL